MNSQDASEMSLPILQGPAKHKDPVCGMMVAPEKAAGKVEHAGKTYCFCSESCTERFSREPERFLAAPGTGGIDHGPAPEKHSAMHQTRASTEPWRTSSCRPMRSPRARKR